MSSRAQPRYARNTSSSAPLGGHLPSPAWYPPRDNSQQVNALVRSNRSLQSTVDRLANDNRVNSLIGANKNRRLERSVAQLSEQFRNQEKIGIVGPMPNKNLINVQHQRTIEALQEEERKAASTYETAKKENQVPPEVVEAIKSLNQQIGEATSTYNGTTIASVKEVLEREISTFKKQLAEEEKKAAPAKEARSKAKSDYRKELDRIKKKMKAADETRANALMAMLSEDNRRVVQQMRSELDAANEQLQQRATCAKAQSDYLGRLDLYDQMMRKLESSSLEATHTRIQELLKWRAAFETYMAQQRLKYLKQDGSTCTADNFNPPDPPEMPQEMQTIVKVLNKWKSLTNAKEFLNDNTKGASDYLAAYCKALGESADDATKKDCEKVLGQNASPAGGEP